LIATICRLDEKPWVYDYQLDEKPWVYDYQLDEKPWVYDSESPQINDALVFMVPFGQGHGWPDCQARVRSDVGFTWAEWQLRTKWKVLEAALGR
jgi:hypothetical protein